MDHNRYSNRCRAATCRLAATIAVAAAGLTRPAWAGDYDRNDLSARELAGTAMVMPDDLDERAPGPCVGNTKLTCPNQSLALGMAVRGSARRHRGNFYVGTEAWLGMHFPQAQFSAGPVIGVGGLAGAETAADGYRRLRGYGEVGIDVLYAGTRVSDVFKVFTEFGLRYQTQTFDRPHSYLHIGSRISTNFNHFGIGMAVGMGWTFD